MADGSTPLHLAAENRNVEVMRVLEAGASDQARKDRITSLYYSAPIGLEAVCLLLDAGACCHHATEDVPTPLHLAAENRHLD